MARHDQHIVLRAQFRAETSFRVLSCRFSGAEPSFHRLFGGLSRRIVGKDHRCSHCHRADTPLRKSSAFQHVWGCRAIAEGRGGKGHERTRNDVSNRASCVVRRGSARSKSAHSLIAHRGGRHGMIVAEHHCRELRGPDDERAAETATRGVVPAAASLSGPGGGVPGSRQPVRDLPSCVQRRTHRGPRRQQAPAGCAGSRRDDRERQGGWTRDRQSNESAAATTSRSAATARAPSKASSFSDTASDSAERQSLTSRHCGRSAGGP